MKPPDANKAIVVTVEGRFHYEIGTTGQLLTAWSLAGAKLFGEWDERADEIVKLYAKKGKAAVKKEVRLT
jgi:hypothetical protein